MNEFIVRCLEHGAELNGDLLVIYDEDRGTWSIDFSEMSCPVGTRSECVNRWKIFLSFDPPT